MLGLTESTAVISHTSTHDVYYGSCGSLLPGYEAKLLAPDGSEIHEYDTPGELVVRGPPVVMGYLNNPKATAETFVDGWLRTGDEAVIRKSAKGHEHVFVVDRIKELIKVKVCTPWNRCTGVVSDLHRAIKWRPPSWRRIS